MKLRWWRRASAKPGTDAPSPPPAPAQAAGPGTTRPGARSVRVSGDNLGIIATGDHTTNVQTVLPAQAFRPVAQVTASLSLVNVPAHAGVFVGRVEELAALQQALSVAEPVVVAAVHGLGGIGKSTLAARYAAGRARAGVFNPVWWITADTPASIEAGLAALMVALQPELASALPARALAERAAGWLSCHPGWLLVLDNLAHPDHITGLLDRTLAGRLLVTSRLGTGWHQLGASVVRLDVLSETEAIDLLARIAGRLPGAGLDGAAELVRELGCLPLAVEQAAAYLNQNHLSPRAYLDLLTAHPAQMYDQAAEGGDGERTVARIWRLTLDRLTTTPLAGDLLRILAWYAPEQIPRDLLDGLATAPRTQQALGRLAAYNLISLDAAGVTVHRLVQAVARTGDPADPHRQPDDIDTARVRAVTLLDRARPDGYDAPASWPRWRRLLPHIEALFARTAPDADTADAQELLRNTGLFLEDQGAVGRALTYLKRCMALAQRVHTLDHPAVLVARASLAFACKSAGDLGQAIPLYEQTLAERERVLGPDHPDTLTSGDNLAGAYRAAGDLGRAVPLYEVTLTKRERVLGPDHPDTLSSRNNLAGAYQAAGDLVRAVPLYEQTLVDCERVLGPDHPHSLTSRNNLAYAYQAVGDLVRAVPLYEQTLADCERVLGPDHPDTLTSRNNLAGVYRAGGDLVRAAPLYEQTLAERERVLGPDHPDTLTSRNNLAYVYQAAGDLVRAVPLYEQTLAERERVLGPDHPSTLISRNNLAGAYQAAGHVGRAVSLYERALADCERVLGCHHPIAKAVRGNLDRARG
ncbi:FxSxx-COOH system tetratricopeptide repeat protein [Nonomuraea typhae]|uniref:FxSxx-COOH system tetratricopeptide repeat protein n=1 Tax=Nonomuraea typhae TaxID=2603600 RepID=UPI0012FBF674|nr:FxSxx-COOH system tetratricopeptide repeat protein [Nonomuraea typhae]